MRTHYSTEVTEDKIDSTITVSGWINSIRDHGGVYFIDLRDKNGLVQLVANPTSLADEIYTKFHSLRDEWVIEVSGLVRLRGEGLENPNLITGKIEIVADDVKVLSKAKTLPFQPGDKSVNQDIKLKYRYLEMRDKELQKTLKMRSDIALAVRNVLHSEDYEEIETPILIKSSEGGAEEVYATSKLFPGDFYSLPQSPQMYKQMLMVGGVEKYYSFAKCFRAESARTDRSIEFTQLDMERAFGNREAIMSDVVDVFEASLKTANISINSINSTARNNVKFLFNIGIDGWIDDEKDLLIPQITYADAMNYFGSDKPDLRFEMPLIEAKKLFVNTDFTVFKDIAEQDNTVIKALVAKGADYPDKLSKKKIKDLEKFVSGFGAKGLAYFQMKEDGLKGPLTKFLKTVDLDLIQVEAQLEIGDIIFFGAGDTDIVLDYMGRLRIEIANQLNLIPEDTFAPLWVTDFPMFEKTSEGGIKAMHHPFTAPLEDSWKQYKDGKISELEILSDSYDLVLNGVELGGGSVRIHNQDLQSEMFTIMGLTEEEVKDKFSFFVEALSYGTPPHAGFAFGYDRLVSLLLSKDSIRDVIAFPKAQSATCPMTDSPNTPDNSQLKDLGLRLRK